MTKSTLNCASLPRMTNRAVCGSRSINTALVFASQHPTPRNGGRLPVKELKKMAYPKLSDGDKPAHYKITRMLLFCVNKTFEPIEAQVLQKVFLAFLRLDNDMDVLSLFAHRSFYGAKIADASVAIHHICFIRCE